MKICAQAGLMPKSDALEGYLPSVITGSDFVQCIDDLHFTIARRSFVIWATCDEQNCVLVYETNVLHFKGK